MKIKIIIIALLPVVIACGSKPIAHHSISVLDTDTIAINAKNAIKVKIKHGDSINVALRYNGPLISLDYFTNTTDHWSLFFGEDNMYYPEWLLFRENQFNALAKKFRFHQGNGSIAELIQSKDNSKEGPYYLFDQNGCLLVSGFYNNDNCSGIWRHYKSNGEIIETINANINHKDVLKHFGIDE